jgi:hypothetical protein
MIRRAFRVLVVSVLGRAVTQRSKRWLAVAGGLVVLRAMDRLASRPARKARGRA